MMDGWIVAAREETFEERLISVQVPSGGERKQSVKADFPVDVVLKS